MPSNSPKQREQPQSPSYNFKPSVESKQQVTGPRSSVMEQKEQKEAAEEKQTEKFPALSFPVALQEPISFSDIEASVAEHSEENGLVEQQALLETKVMEAMETIQMDVDRLQEAIKTAKTDEEKAILVNQLFDKKRELDQIRADYEKNNAEFEKNLKAEMERRAELLKERREAAKVCKRLLL